MTHVDYDPAAGQWVLTCDRCPVSVAADTRQEIDSDRVAHEDWHANTR